MREETTICSATGVSGPERAHSHPTPHSHPGLVPVLALRRTLASAPFPPWLRA
ncbi:hypothetical protein ACIP2Y_04800 [Streptomyces sviceus]|uniref:hypothetical protein n=1 Tax=Streptomyces sviceus TaxID=285530 RepID=UPI0038055FED